MYIKVTSDTPEKYNLGKLRRDNPTVSFPKQISDETLAEFSVYSYTVVEADHEPLTQNLVEGDFYQDDSGNWFLPLQAENMDPDTAARNVRHKRDNLLAETDWVVTSYTERGEEIPDSWKSYRQSLRDLTVHVDFPFVAASDWPVKP